MPFRPFLAYFVKGLCGFANTLVFSSILSFWQDNIYITPIDLPLSLISNLLLVFHDHKALSVKIWGSGAFFMILGIIWHILLSGDPALIKIILGFLTMGLALQMLLKKNPQAGQGALLVMRSSLSLQVLSAAYWASVPYQHLYGPCDQFPRSFSGQSVAPFYYDESFSICHLHSDGNPDGRNFQYLPYLGSFHAGRAFGRHHAFIPSRRDARPTRHHFLPASFRCRPCGDKSPHITAFPVVYLQQDP